MALYDVSCLLILMPLYFSLSVTMLAENVVVSRRFLEEILRRLEALERAVEKFESRAHC